MYNIYRVHGIHLLNHHFESLAYILNSDWITAKVLQWWAHTGTALDLCERTYQVPLRHYIKRVDATVVENFTFGSHGVLWLVPCCVRTHLNENVRHPPPMLSREMHTARRLNRQAKAIVSINRPPFTPASRRLHVTAQLMASTRVWRYVSVIIHSWNIPKQLSTKAEIKV